MKRLLFLMFKSIDIRTIIAYLTFVLVSTPLLGQVVSDAPEDKAVVYFVRTVKGTGILAYPGVFCENGPIGILSYRNFIRYECEPGDQLFWILRGNISPITFTNYKQFIDTKLLAGKIYLIEVRVLIEGIRMEPVNPVTDLDRLDRIKSVLNSKSSIKANKMMKKKDYHKKKIHKSWTKLGMEKYPEFVEKGKVDQLYSHWFVEPEDLLINKSQ